jgi:UTP--glucose-1-phosphate uridylyltransferase
VIPVKVTKAIIPAAGLGTRFLPATKAMPKEMLPLIDKPVIQWIIEEAVHSGIEDILIVTGRHKRAIEDHFDKSFELEVILERAGQHELLRQVRDISDMVNVHYIRQKEPLGLGHAISCARTFVGNEPFAVMLGDIVVDHEVPCLQQLIDVYEQTQSNVLAVLPVEWSDVHKYGIIDGETLATNRFRVRDLVEKPKSNPPSNLAIAGRYILNPKIFSILQNLSPGIGGEIQLTDGLRELNRMQEIIAYMFEGKLYDVGSKSGYLEATVDFALKRADLREGFLRHLCKAVKEHLL